MICGFDHFTERTMSLGLLSNYESSEDEEEEESEKTRQPVSLIKPVSLPAAGQQPDLPQDTHSPLSPDNHSLPSISPLNEKIQDGPLGPEPQISMPAPVSNVPSLLSERLNIAVEAEASTMSETPEHEPSSSLSSQHPLPENSCWDGEGLEWETGESPVYVGPEPKPPEQPESSSGPSFSGIGIAVNMHPAGSQRVIACPNICFHLNDTIVLSINSSK
jgi:hypothetical protein